MAREGPIASISTRFHASPKAQLAVLYPPTTAWSGVVGETHGAVVATCMLWGVSWAFLKLSTYLSMVIT